MFGFASLFSLADVDTSTVREVSSPLQSIFMRFFWQRKGRRRTGVRKIANLGGNRPLAKVL
jgi:hypothetical protein